MTAVLRTVEFELRFTMTAFIFLSFAALSLLMSTLAADNTCYAPGPLVDGPVCKSSTELFGRPGSKVHYSIYQVNDVGTLICCKALGCGPRSSLQCSAWGWYSIGCSKTSLQEALPWGNNAAYPSIQCTGSPVGTPLTWSA